jgi:hypothetical protein
LAAGGGVTDEERDRSTGAATAVGNDVEADPVEMDRSAIGSVEWSGLAAD